MVRTHMLRLLARFVFACLHRHHPVRRAFLREGWTPWTL